jgi:CheY-like chemotaxis protein
MRADARAFRVLGDRPYEGERDPLGFGGLAQELKSLILASRESTPFTIGIEASWGRGKSTLMGKLEEELAHQPKEDDVHIKTVSFNAWTAEDEDLLEGLVKSVLQAMDGNILRRTLRNKRLISAAKIPVLLVAGWLRVDSLVNEAWDRLSVDASTRNQVNALVRQAMEDWSKKVSGQTSKVGPNQLLVVFIDDLDRCSPENVLKVFEGLKLYLDAPGFVFVIGYDEGIISEAVADRKQFSVRATGRDYIEKIVQIVFRIPQPTEDEVEDLLAHVLDESATVELFDHTGRKLVIERNARNPRRMKRFVNRFILDYKLDEASQDLEAEVLIKVLIFETYFPEFSRLFDVASEDQKNPIQEFLDFVTARDALRRADATKVDDEVFSFYGIAQAQTPEESLERLQAEVPELFVRLSRDDDFLSLARSVSVADQTQIVNKVQRRKERATSVPPAEAMTKSASLPSEASSANTLPDLWGRRILWLDDKPENNNRLVEQLTATGARVELATSAEAATELLPSVAPDLLISDIGRGERFEAGFEDLEQLRADGNYDGPVIFYTARVTTKRRAKAEELGTKIVNGEDELLQAISEALPVRPIEAETPVPA